jgi:hypothetical protein
MKPETAALIGGLALLLLCVLGLTTVSYAQETRIYKVDPYGNTRYDQPRLVIKGNRIYEADAFGNIQYHKGYGVITTKPEEPVQKTKRKR